MHRQCTKYKLTGFIEMFCILNLDFDIVHQKCDKFSQRGVTQAERKGDDPHAPLVQSLLSKAEHNREGSG